MIPLKTLASQKDSHFETKPLVKELGQRSRKFAKENKLISGLLRRNFCLWHIERSVKKQEERVD